MDLISSLEISVSVCFSTEQRPWWCHVRVHTVTRTFLPHPWNLQKLYTSFETVTESSVKSVNWTKQIRFLLYWSCYPENTVLFTQGFLSCSQVQHLWNPGIILCTYGYKWVQDVTCIFHQEGWNSTTSEQRLQTTEKENWLWKAVNKNGLFLSCITWHSTYRADLMPAWKKIIRPDGTEMIKKAEILGCQCQMNTNIWRLVGFEQRMTLSRHQPCKVWLLRKKTAHRQSSKDNRLKKKSQEIIFCTREMLLCCVV